MRNILLLLFALLLTSCDNGNLLNFEVIDRKVYDVPLKSQITTRVEITDSIYTDDQVKELISKLVEIESGKPMKYHKLPTHVFIYLYRNKIEYEGNDASWIAMYQKIGEPDTGRYLFHDPTSLFDSIFFKPILKEEN